MAFSIQSFIKNNCNEQYDVKSLDKLAERASIESNGRYTIKNTHKFLCRYAYVKDGNILLDYNKRQSEQTFNDILKIINTPEPSNQPKSGFGNLKVNTPLETLTQTKNTFGKLKVKTTLDTLKQTGFGNLSRVNLDTPPDSPKQQTKSNSLSKVNIISELPKQQTKSGFGNFSKVNIISELPKKQTKSGFGNLSRVNLDTPPDSPKQQTKSINLSKVNITSELPKKQIRSGFGNLSRVNLDTPPDSPKQQTKSINLSKINIEQCQDDDINTLEIQRRTKTYEKLSSQYYPPQRSEEWFKARETMITASNGGTLLELNPYEYDFQYIFNMVFGKPFETNEACYHGKKYEQIATMIYEQLYNVKVKEFGLCSHPKYNFLGASPDGIVSKYKLKLRNNKKWNEIEKEVEQIQSETEKCEYIDAYGIKTKLVGRMLEIKCPNRRRIKLNLDEPITDLILGSKKGICPSYYWCQVQLQLNCCELDECDFWQCEIIEYADRNDYLNDTKTKGVVIQLMPIEHINNDAINYENRIYNYASFIYPPQIDMTTQELDLWILSTMDKLHETHKNYICESVKYWYLRTSRNVTIMRDDEWFNNNISKLRSAWDKIEFLRAHKDIALLLKNYIASFPVNKYGQIIDKQNKINKAITALISNPTDKKILKNINDAIKK